MSEHPPPATSPDDAFARARRELMAEIEDEVRRFGTGDGGFGLEPQVREAMLKVARERFVPEDLRARAYDNRPLPIGHGQTISQPLVVALMTHHLHIAPMARILEVGTGSGYQTAILAELAQEVVTVEIVAPLAERARAVLESLGYRNIVFRVGDGTRAAADLAPFDGIMVTAAADRLREELIRQLAPGGRMVIPVGGFLQGQDLLLITKEADGSIVQHTLFPVAFVPLTGERGPQPS